MPSFLGLLGLTVQRLGGMRAQLKHCLMHSSISTQKQSTHLELKHGLLLGTSSTRWDL